MPRVVQRIDLALPLVEICGNILEPQVLATILFGGLDVGDNGLTSPRIVHCLAAHVVTREPGAGQGEHV